VIDFSVLSTLQLARVLGLLALTLVIAGCGGSGGSGGDETTATPTFSTGKAEKGPYAMDAVVVANLLDDGANSQATQRFGMRDVGVFEIDVNWTGWVLIEVSGDTISEIDINALQPATLTALTRFTDGYGQSNVNSLTHLHAQRSLNLVRAGNSFPSATDQALAELNAAFAISVSDVDELGSLSISPDTTDADRNDAALFVLSAALSVKNSVNGDLTLMADDFADDGILNGAGGNVLDDLRPIAEDLDLQVPMENIRTLMGQVVGYEAMQNTLPAWVTGPVEIQDNVISQQDQDFEVESFDRTSGDLVLSGPDAMNIRAGSIISASDPQTAPVGFLRKVVGVDSVNGKRIAVTEPANLADAIKSGQVSIRAGDGRAEENGSRTLTTAVQSRGAIAEYATNNFLPYRTMKSPYPYRKQFSKGYQLTGQSLTLPDSLFTEDLLVVATPSTGFQDEYDALAYCAISGLTVDRHREVFSSDCAIRSTKLSFGSTRYGVLSNFDVGAIWGITGPVSNASSHARAGAIFGSSFAADFNFRVFSANEGRVRAVLDVNLDAGAYSRLDANGNRTGSLQCDDREDNEVYDRLTRTFAVPAGPIIIAADFGWRCSVDLTLASNIEGIVGGEISKREKREFIWRFHEIDGITASSTVLNDTGLEPTFIRDGRMSGSAKTKLDIRVGTRLYDSFGLLIGPYAQVEGAFETAAIDKIAQFETYDAYTDNLLGYYVQVSAGATASAFFQSDSWKAFASGFGLLSPAGDLAYTFEATSELKKQDTPPIIFAASRYNVGPKDPFGVSGFTIDWIEVAHPDNGDYDPVYQLRMANSPAELKSSFVAVADVEAGPVSIDEFKTLSGGSSVFAGQTGVKYLCLFAYHTPEKDPNKAFGCSQALALEPAE